MCGFDGPAEIVDVQEEQLADGSDSGAQDLGPELENDGGRED